MLPRIANFDDLDPLKTESDVEVVMVPPGSSIPGDAGLVILPGTKSTIADMQAVRDNGWDLELFAHVKRGGYVLGICGGFQMLGRHISDPTGIEGHVRDIDGLALLDVETLMEPEKLSAMCRRPRFSIMCRWTDMKFISGARSDRIW